MTNTVEFQSTHYIAKDALREWLAEYDVDISQIIDATIHIGRHYDRGDVSAWLDIEWYPLNRLHCRYVRGDLSGLAKGHTTIPLRSFPALTPVSPD